MERTKNDMLQNIFLIKVATKMPVPEVKETPVQIKFLLSFIKITHFMLVLPQTIVYNGNTKLYELKEPYWFKKVKILTIFRSFAKSCQFRIYLLYIFTFYTGATICSFCFSVHGIFISY